MQLIFSILVFLNFLQMPVVSTPDISDDTAAAIKSQSATNVAKFFSANIDLKIMDKEDVCSKAQAELILKDFFGKNPVKSFSVIHKGVSKNGDQFAIGNYESTNGKKFRTYFLFKKEGNNLTLQQLRFEAE